MLSKYDQGFLKQYEAQLQKPKWKFILIYGISWVVLVMLLTIPMEYFVFEKGSFTWPRLEASVGIWLLGGVLYGAWLRWYLMRKYKAIRKKSTESMA